MHLGHILSLCPNLGTRILPLIYRFSLHAFFGHVIFYNNDLDVIMGGLRIMSNLEILTSPIRLGWVVGSLGS